jgi:hypothetical protein
VRNSTQEIALSVWEHAAKWRWHASRRKEEKMANPMQAEPTLEPADEPRGAPNSDRFAAETAHHHPTRQHTTDEEEIRVQAYELWLYAGRPEGKDEELWRNAERQVHARKMRTGR